MFGLRGFRRLNETSVFTHEKGMTLMEVVIAIAIFSLGVLFLIKADEVVNHYRIQSEERQQMQFAASGELEKVIKYGTTGTSETNPVTQTVPIGGRTYTFKEWFVQDGSNTYRQTVYVKAIPPGGGDDLILCAYRVEQ